MCSAWRRCGAACATRRSANFRALLSRWRRRRRGMSRADGHLGVGDRFVEGPGPELVDSAFALETAYGPLLYRGMSLADLAHAVMLVEAGIAPPKEGARLLEA